MTWLPKVYQGVGGERWSKWNFASCFSRLERLGYPIFIKEYAESVGRNGISRVAFPGWKTWRKDNVQRPKIDPHVMKG